MANVYDRWHKSRAAAGEPCCAEHGLAPSAAHGQGDRWQVRWYEGTAQRKENFARRYLAERRLTNLAASWCLVPDCKHSAATEPPVLLCAEHRDLLIQQVTRKRPAVHDPLVYFIRNGQRIKIGWTTNLKSRLSALALSPSAAELTIPGGPDQEAIMHARFAKARVGRTEWFEATPELERFIAQRRAASASNPAA